MWISIPHLAKVHWNVECGMKIHIPIVRITVICHDTRLSGFGLEARIEDQKLKTRN